MASPTPGLSVGPSNRSGQRPRKVCRQAERCEVTDVSSIEKQANGRYRARYRDLNGRSRSQTFGTKGEARRYLDRSSTDMQRSEWIDPAVRRIQFDTWANTWWGTTRKLRTATRRGYHQLLSATSSPTSPVGPCPRSTIST